MRGRGTSMNIVLDHRVAVASILARGSYQPASHPIARIHLLGPIRATSYLGDDILPPARKARALLAYLCLASGAKVSRARIAALLWDRSTEEEARTHLRKALAGITSRLGPLAREVIEAGRATIRLNANACWIDALAVLQSASLTHLCTGTLLDGLDGISTAFDSWLAKERIRFAERLRSLPAPRETRAAVALAAPSHLHKTLPCRTRLRVAVLPFNGRGANESHLASSLSHEIAAALARFRWFDVISPAPVDLFHKELDYAVDGTVSRHGRVVEIRVRLLDLTQSTQPIWSERFELKTGELHRLNDMVTPRVVGTIDPVILHIEGQPKRREHYGATGLLLLAIPLLNSMERKNFRRAGELIEQALGIDPQNPMALAWSAIWHLATTCHGWAPDPAATLAQAEALSLKAIAIEPENAEALGIYAHTCAWKKDFDAAVKHFDLSLRVNPNLAYVWSLSAATYCYIGQPNEALRRLKRHHDLSPFDPHSFLAGNFYILAYLLKYDYEQAILIGRPVVKEHPDYGGSYKPLIAALGHLGRTDEAKPFIDKLLTLEPNFTVERFQQVYPLKHDCDCAHYATGLRLAGVPER